ncbi:MAG: outer membrane beta-barrel protein [Prolixibacteraceae bacterium]|nr:outer membrane beta-barrel protein [Prolixibacteraceae bacterium]
MKQLVAIFLIGFLAVEALGQQSVDVGIFGGTGTYFGDMTKIDFQKSTNPAYGGFVRFNFNPRYGLRFNVVNGTIGAEGKFETYPWTFSKNVLDISLNFEFNFMKYIVGDKTTPWSTYISGGVGVQNYKFTMDQGLLAPMVHPSYFQNAEISGSVVAPTVPFGLGVKYTLSKRWGIGLEGSLRKTFSDKLDDLNDPLSYVTPEDIQIKYADQTHNNDWTAYVGIHLVYKMIHGNQEWELKTPRKNMLDWGIWNKNRKQ